MKVPPEMRDFAERSVEQARKAFDSFMTAAQRAAVRSATPRRPQNPERWKSVERRWAMPSRTCRPPSTSRAASSTQRDTQEILTLQSEFMRAQLAAFSEQARTIGAAATRVAKDVTSDPSKKG